VCNDTTPRTPFTVQNGFYVNLSNCAKYHSCSNAIDILHTCPTGLLWNSAATACDWPANVQCGSGGGSSACTPLCSGKECGDDGCGGVAVSHTTALSQTVNHSLTH